MKTSLIFGTVILVVGAGAMFFCREPCSQRALPSESAVARTVERHPDPSIPFSSSSRTAGTPNRSDSGAAGPTSVRLAFNKIEDGRAFAIYAWQHPEQGGVFYAERVARECRALRLSTDYLEQHQPSANIRPEHMIAVAGQLARWDRLCGQFTPEELEKYTLQTGESTPLQGKDLLLLQAAQLRLADRSNGKISRDVAVGKILDTADPLLLDSLGARLSSTERGMYFDGRYYSSSDDKVVLLAAYKLLPCGLGLACDQYDFDLSLNCVRGAECYSNRLEMIRSQTANRDPAIYAQIDATYKALLEAVRQKNVAAFVPEPGS